MLVRLAAWHGAIEVSSKISAGHDGKDPMAMLAFVNGALREIVAFAPTDITRNVTAELQQQVEAYINEHVHED